MTAHDFLERIEQDGLVDRAVIGALRRKISQPGKELSARRVGKFLVGKGYLDQSQVDSILNDVASSDKGEAMKSLTEDDLIADAEPAPAEKSSSRKSKKRSSSSRSKSKRKKKSESLTMLQSDDVVEEEDIVDLAAGTTQPADLADLGELTDHDPLGVHGDGIAAEEPKKEKKKSFDGKFVVENQWDSKWIFIGPTIVVFLLLATAFLWFLLGRGDAEKHYEAFLEAYKGERYQESIELGDVFLTRFKRNENAEEVAIFRGMARIRIPVEGKEWNDALEKFDEVLPELIKLEGYRESGAAEDVPVLLMDVSGGFAARAEAAADDDIARAEELVNFARRARALADVPEYVSSSQRKNPAIRDRLIRIDESIGRVQELIDTERRLEESIDQISIALGETDTVKAFEVHKDLLRRDPRVESDPRLLAKVREISLMEKSLVDVSSVSLSPAETVADPVVGRHVIATRVGDVVVSLDGEYMPILLNGSVYVINVGTGEVAWRKHVGIETQYQPQWIDPQDRSSLLLVNEGQQALISMDVRTGNVNWQTAINEPFAEPVIANQRAYVATRSGALIEVDLNSGQAERQAQIPQTLYTGPTTDARSQFVYQPGIHSHIYKLSASSFECTEVYYLGYAAGSVEVPPVVASDYLFVAENRSGGASGPDTCLIHVLIPRPDGIEPAQEPIRLEGKVIERMQLYSKRVLVITDRGSIALLDVDVTSDSRPVTSVADFNLETDERARDFFTAANSRLFVGDIGLTGFLIQAQRGRLERTTATNSDDRFVAPMQIFGDVLVHSRVRRGSSLVSVSAVDVETADQIWRIDLAAPLAGPLLVNQDASNITAVNAEGDQFTWTPDQLSADSNRMPDRRGSTTMQDLVFPFMVPVGDGHALAFGPGATVPTGDGGVMRQVRTMLVDPQQSGPSSVIGSRDMAYDHIGARPIAFAGGALLVSKEGQIFLLDGVTARDAATPFQPAIEPGVLVNWCQPAIVDSTRFAVADARGVVYRVDLANPGQNASLVKGGEYRHEDPLASGLASFDGLVFVVAQGDTSQSLLAINIETLELVKSIDLSGRIVAGPYQGAGMTMLAMDNGEMMAFDRELEHLWSFEYGNAIPVDSPIVEDRELHFAMNRGFILTVNADDGEVIGQTNLNEPIYQNPTVIDNKWVFDTLDGNLLVVEP